jgi:hypothetical protein
MCTRGTALATALVAGAGVTELVAQPSPTAIIGRIRSTGSRPIDFHAAAFPDTVYVGQQVTYQVAVLLSEQARARLRRNPEFLPPELRGLLAYELGTPARVPSRGYGGALSYEAHVFQRALFGVTAGTLRVPSPQLSYSLPQSASYFSREERFEVRAESAQLVVKPLPVEGRPADFTGAVGVLRASTRLDAATARVGDPLVLTVRIEGTGNVRLFPRPGVEVSWATVVAGNERVRVDTSGALVRGVKEFDFLLTPTRDGPVTLPVVRYGYFDPYRRSYAVAETRPADVVVAPGALAGIDSDEETETLRLRVWRPGEAATLDQLSFGARWGAIALLAVVPLPALVTLAGRLRRQRRRAKRPDTTAPTRDAVVDDDSPAVAARRTRRTLLSALATRLHVAPAELVTRADVERVLRRRGATRATSRAVLLLLDELDVAGFGSPHQPVREPVSDAGNSSWDARAGRLLDAVDSEAVPHGRTPLWGRRARRAGTLAMMLTLLPVAGLPVLGSLPALAEAQARTSAPSCVAPNALELLVGEGVAAYNARRFAAAAQRLAAAVDACPRNVDLLVNWGSAAWAAHDTVAAVVAWQRAARLDPLAADIQTRLALLPPGARGGLAEVPMVPVFGMTGAAAAAWTVAWLLLLIAWREPRGRPALNASAVLLLLAAVGAGATAWWGVRALDATALAVVRRPETLHGAPGFESTTAGGVSTGDVVSVSTAQEGWVRVTLADGRSGWLPASRLAPLLAAAPTR